jgi:hypothetical protein
MEHMHRDCKMASMRTIVLQKWHNFTQRLNQFSTLYQNIFLNKTKTQGTENGLKPFSLINI